MNKKNTPESIFDWTFRLITGPENPADRSMGPLGGHSWQLPQSDSFISSLSSFFQPLLGSGRKGAYLKTLLEEELLREKTVFDNHYQGQSPPVCDDPEELAALVSRYWLPELNMEDDEILRRWKLRNVYPNSEPICPEQVVLQLNALYTRPENPLPRELPPEWRAVLKEEGTLLADYDHPVPLFCEEKDHELLRCLDELDRDMEFEKSQGILPGEYRIPVTISVSVTHRELTPMADDWLRKSLEKKGYKHLRCLLLTQEMIADISNRLFSISLDFFGVSGKYSRHFNALKYFQLVLEKAYGIRAGFKLDTDEGIHSRELFHATGKTWMETLCHPYWGGRAEDWKGRKVVLGINEGEYIDSRDVDRLGYPGSLREPDVKMPSTFRGPEMFFHKGIAHARATALYNQFDCLNDFISHPVVKGGGYGITNESLRSAVPFVCARVGRAEDQQFYFSALSRGVRGIFHPDLRIVHYKSQVSGAEKKTEASRLVGDMYRLLLFRHLVKELKVKDDIDPMPGVFAGKLAGPQSLFNLLYRSWDYHKRGDSGTAKEALARGLPELKALKEDIASGLVKSELKKEHREWTGFIREAAALDPEKVKIILEPLFI